MDLEAGDGVTRAGHGGNRASKHERALRRHRRLAARELNAMSLAFTATASVVMFSLAMTLAHPPAWVSRARETGEQRLGAVLFELLNRLAFMDAAVLVVVLCIDRVRPVPAERILAEAWRLFNSALKFYAAWIAMAGSGSWGVTSAAFSIIAASDTITWHYALGKLKGRLLGPSLVGLAGCMGILILVASHASS